MAVNILVSRLLDRYGSLLPEKQQRILDGYYNNDLSLGEIAENEGISRQGVSDFIKRGEAQLNEFEEKLGLCDTAAALRAAADAGDIEKLKEIIEKL